MSKKSKIEVRVDSRLEQLKSELEEITLSTRDWQEKYILVKEKIEMLEEILTAPDGKDVLC